MVLTIRIGDRFDLAVPLLMMCYGQCGGIYAGIGVTPDRELPAESALDVALQEVATRR